MKKQVAVIFGGRSAEHEVSLRSAKSIVDAMDKNLFNPILIGISKCGDWFRFADTSVFSHTKIDNTQLPAQAEPVTLISKEGKPYLYSFKDQSASPLDIAFPVLHGTMGEDGTIQGLFKMIQLPFVGCGVWSSSSSMDKEIMKRLFTEAQIPNARYLLLTPQNPLSFDEVAQKLGTPFFIKPANAGSSVGVHKIKSKEDFASKLADSFQFDHKVLAEEFMQGREIECSVMGLNQEPAASLPGEIIPQHEFYSYEAKYLDDNGALLKIPAELSDSQIKDLQDIAKKTYRVMGCDGLTRVDFFLRNDGKFYVNEINTLPGFTKISMYPKMWEATGLKYGDLVTQLIELGFKKFTEEQKLKLSYLE